MSKALACYINNIKKKGIKISEKTIVDTINNESKKINIINILKDNKNYIEEKNLADQKEYKVTVKLYMTKSDSFNFTFHTTWNQGKAMPLRVMYGTILESTKTMYKMKLYGKITQTDICLKCGKPLTNAISKLYGLGPDCGQHYYINPLSETDFIKDKNILQDKFNNITWEGWVPKVSIVSLEEIHGEVN